MAHTDITFGDIDPHIASHFQYVVRFLVRGLCDAGDSNILPAAVLLQPINVNELMILYPQYLFYPTTNVV